MAIGSLWVKTLSDNKREITKEVKYKLDKCWGIKLLKVRGINSGFILHKNCRGENIWCHEVFVTIDKPIPQGG